MTRKGASAIEPDGHLIHFGPMGQIITVRLTKELADWLARTAARTEVSQGRIVRDQLERAKAAAGNQAFMRLAGAVRGPKDLSSRKGLSSRRSRGGIPTATPTSPTSVSSA